VKKVSIHAKPRNSRAESYVCTVRIPRSAATEPAATSGIKLTAILSTHSHALELLQYARQRMHSAALLDNVFLQGGAGSTQRQVVSWPGATGVGRSEGRAKDNRVVSHRERIRYLCDGVSGFEVLRQPCSSV
jgi:hypothetical protein